MMAISVVGAGNAVDVGRGVTIFVGGRVDVTKWGAGGVPVCTETVIQDVSNNAKMKYKDRVFVMVDFQAM